MAARVTQPMISDGITSVVPIVEKHDETPRVAIFLPEPIDSGSGNKVDPYEHVTINGEKPYYVMRGVHVEVPVPVYLQLRNRYPNI